MGGDWHKEDSQLRLLPPRPPPVSFISHVPSLFMLLDGFCLPGHALSISCASPRRKVIVAAPLLALLITFSLFPTHEYFFFSAFTSFLRLGCTKLCIFLQDSPRGCHPGALNTLALPAPYIRLSALRATT